MRDFQQVVWDEQAEADCQQLVRLAVAEDLGRGYDLTTLALVAADARGAADVVARQSGVVAGLPAACTALEAMGVDAQWQPLVDEGTAVAAGAAIARLDGATRDLLTAERILLNLLGRLCGVATLTRRYVEAVAGTSTRIYDTRKTTPGWRRLEKYAVGQGGGRNHRAGLYDAVLIKDNHLAQAQVSPADAVRRARQFLLESAEILADQQPLIEVEVDSLDQLDEVLPLAPDIVLLDNMTLDELRAAVDRRDALAQRCQLEASGGITLDSVRSVAQTGVDRISIGALTHSAGSLDLGLDWSGGGGLAAC